MARHPVRMMEATRLMVSGLAERLILLENGEILREEICGWSQTRGEHPQVLPREQMRLVMRIVNKMTADFLKDGTAYLEFASALEASRAVQRYLEARFDCSSSGSPAEDLEYGQAFIDYLLD